MVYPESEAFRLNSVAPVQWFFSAVGSVELHISLILISSLLSICPHSLKFEALFPHFIHTSCTIHFCYLLITHLVLNSQSEVLHRRTTTTSQRPLHYSFFKKYFSFPTSPLKTLFSFTNSFISIVNSLISIVNSFIYIINSFTSNCLIRMSSLILFF